jgi:hypothetical protein
MLHRMAAPVPAAAVRLKGTPARVGTPRPQRHPATPGLAPAGAGVVRGSNPYSYVAQHLCQPAQQGARYTAPGQQPFQYQPYQQQQYVPPGYGAEQAFGFQGMAAYAGMPFMGNPFGGVWQQQQGDGTTTWQQIRFPATPLPVQPYEVEAACTWVVNCCPELPTNRIQRVFSIAQSGEILTVRAPRDGKDWMRLNPRQEEQRWSALNARIAVLSSTKVAADRTTLEQFELLVQPTQFLEYLRKTMPMSEAQLNMITAMHETLWRRLNALEVFFRGGQRAVDEFNKSTLTGIEKTKAIAIAKAGQGGRNGQGGQPPGKCRRRSGGGQSGTGFSALQATQQASTGANSNAPRQQQLQDLKMW